MALTKVTSGVRTLGTGEVATANMAVDPTNASNLASGSVPSARLGNVDNSGLRNDISTLALHSAIADNKAAFNLTNSFIDQYEDSTGIDVLTDCQRNTSGEYVASTVAASEIYHPNAGGIANSYGSQASTVTGTNNETATLKSISSGGSALMNDQAGKTRGVFTLITELVQAGQYAGAHAYGYAVVKNTDSLDNPPYSDDDALGYPSTTMNGMSVGSKIKVVYDTDNENVLTHYVDTGSGYGSAITTVNSAGPDYESTTLVTPYFYIVAWSDTAQPWILTCSGTRDYSDVNATGNYTSTTETANATVSKMGVVVLYKNAYGTATLDTDLIVQVSADGGSNYTSAPLTAAGTFSTGILSAKSNDITISNTGTTPKYKISFANQSLGVKETQVHGVALLYQDGHNMSYIGNQPPDIGAYDVESFDGGGTSFTLKRAATTPSVLLFIDGVRQTPTDAYSVSGVTLTTTGTTPSGTANVTVMFMGDVVDIGAPSDDTVSTAKIQDDAVTAAKLANSINTEIAANTAKVTNATHTGDVTGATALTIADNAVTLAKLEDGTQGDILYYGASGAPARLGFGTSGDFLKTQGTGANPVWAAAGGTNTPAFMATMGGSPQSIADNTNTKVEMSLEVFDTDDTYDPTTNYRWTPGVVGKYLIGYSVYFEGDQIHRALTTLYKNGSLFGPQTYTQAYVGGGYHPDRSTKVNSCLIDVTDAADYFEVWCWIDTDNSSAVPVQDAKLTFFWGHKLLT